MEDLFGIQTRRQAVQENIEKAFTSGINMDEEIEKARSGVYANTAENRKLARVGQQYGGKKQPDSVDTKSRFNSEIEQLKNKLFNEQSDAYNEVMSKLTDDKDRLSGKIAVDDKYGKYDSKEYLRMLYEFKNAPNSRLKSIISENSKSNEPFNVADKKAAIEILEKRKAGDKMFQPKKKEDEQSSKKESSKIQNNSDKLTRVEKSEIIEKVNKFIRKHYEGSVALERTDEGKQLISELKKYGSEKVGKFMKQKFETTSSEGRSNWFYDLGEMVMGKDVWEKLFTLERHDEYLKTFENEIKLEWDEPETKKEKEVLKKTINSFKEFLEKNPKIKLDEDEILAIIDGSATEEEEFEHLTKLKGFNELNEQIEKYVDREE